MKNRTSAPVDMTKSSIRNFCAKVLDLAGIEIREHAERSRDGVVELGVEQRQLVAAEHDEGAGLLRRPDVARTNRSDVVAAHAVLAAGEQPFEDRQIFRGRAPERMDVIQLAAHAKR